MSVFIIESFSEWRRKSRQLLSERVDPSSIDLVEKSSQQLLFGGSGETNNGGTQSISSPPKASSKPALSVPRSFLSLAETVAYHRSPQRWNLLYRLLWRLTGDEPQLLEISTDDDVLQLHRMEKEVRRDAHKMKAFVRFRKVMRDEKTVEEDEYFIAWHRPDHRIVRKVAPFFSRRFKAMNWSILTPEESVHWDQRQLVYGEGVPRNEAPQGDELEELWKTYYRNIFNPARIKISAMKSEMPVKHWQTLPEAEVITDLLAAAPQRVEEMIANHEGFEATAAEWIAGASPPPEDLNQLAILARSCRACDLHCTATQIVFGEGRPQAKLVVVGEQPGDQEDLAGRPFVGPAGHVLEQALESAKIDRSEIYLTNIVKHFKHQEISSSRGKRRLHQKPDSREVRCCKPWFIAEWAMLDNPKVLVCLGGTAAKAILGPNFRLKQQRGQIVSSELCEHTIATWHPAAILRMPDEIAASQIREELANDLQAAGEIVEKLDSE